MDNQYFEFISKRYPWATEETLQALNSDLTSQNITMGQIAAILSESNASVVKTTARKADEAQAKAEKIEKRIEKGAKKAKGAMGSVMSDMSPIQAVADLSHETAKLMYNAGAAAGDFLGGGKNKVGAVIGGVTKAGLYGAVAATGVGTVFAKLLTEQDKYARQLIDFGSIVGDIDMYTTLRSSIRSLGMGFKEFADITAATQPFMISAGGDVIKGQYKLSEMLSQLEKDDKFSDFGMGIQDTARSLAQETETLYQLGQITEINAMTKKRVADSFESANALAMFTGNNLGMQRMEALNIRNEARTNEELQFNIIQNTKKIEELFGKAAVQNIEQAQGTAAILMTGTFGEDFAKTFEQDVISTVGDFEFDTTAANNVNREMIEKLRRVGPGVAEEYISLVEDTAQGKITSNKQMVDRQRKLVKMVQDAMPKPGVSSDLRDSNELIARTKALPDSYLSADTDELLTTSYYKGIIDNADSSIDTIDDFAVTFQNLQEILTPGFGTMDTGINLVTDNMLKFGRAVSGFFGKSSDFDEFYDKQMTINREAALAQVTEKNIDITIEVAKQKIDAAQGRMDYINSFIETPEYTNEAGETIEATDEQIEGAEAQQQMLETQLMEQKEFYTMLLTKKADMDSKKVTNGGVQ
jgi:hypothetical protein